MRRILSIATMTLLTAISSPAVCDTVLPRPDMDREAAVATLDDSRGSAVLGPLYSLAREGRGAELDRQVRRIALGDDLPDAERDRVLFTLAVALGDLGPGVVGPRVLETLAETRSRVLVPSDDHPEMGVPLFNIRAAAVGALSQWKKPGLDEDDVDADRLYERLKGNGERPTVQDTRRASVILNDDEIESVLAIAATAHDPGTAGMILAELSRGRTHRPVVQDVLFDLLADDELGAAAALALASDGDAAVNARLARKASSGQDTAARRAATALRLVPGEDVEP